MDAGVRPPPGRYAHIDRELGECRRVGERCDDPHSEPGRCHGDLHQENYFFQAGAAGTIDFDDCGWGFHLYDLAVTLSEIEGRPGYERLRDALLDAYARQHPLPADADVHLRALIILRRVQLLMWILESREHAAFRDDWHPWANKELRGLPAALAHA